MGKTIYRIPPFPDYDIEALESWLTDLAGQGLFLNTGGLYWGLARFRRGEPRRLPHRLIAPGSEVSLAAGLLGKKPPEDEAPTQEVRDFYAQWGWEYVGTHAYFHLYRGMTEAPRELHTDPEVQADTLRRVYRRLRLGNLGVLLACLVCLGILLLLSHGSFWGILCEYPWCTPLLLLLLPLAVWNIWSVHRYYRDLAARTAVGDHPDHGKNWARRARGNLVKKILSTALAVLLLVSLWVPQILATHHDRRQDPWEYDLAALPFATATDLLPPEVYYEPNFDPLMEDRLPSYVLPRSLHWVENNLATWPDGTTARVYLNVIYLQANFPQAAQAKLEQLERQMADWEEAPFPVPEFAGEYKALFFHENYPVLLVRKGNQVMRVGLDLKGDHTLPLEEWSRELLASLV